MGECAQYRIRIFRSGAFVYHGIDNVRRMGRHKGSVNVYEFDSLAATIEVMGVFEQSSFERYGLTTVGDYEISIETESGEKSFSRDGARTPPMFATIVSLTTTLLSNAKWGDGQYIEAEASYPEVLRLAKKLNYSAGKKRRAFQERTSYSRTSGVLGMVFTGIAIFIDGLDGIALWWIVPWVIFVLSFLVILIPDRRSL